LNDFVQMEILNENIKDDESLLSRELALFTAMIALIASAIIVLVERQHLSSESL